MLESQKGKVLPLIYPTSQGKLALNTQTLSHISQYRGPYCFVSICGDYRSGKSFLLNSLFFDYQGFETSGTTQACTKGINIWSEPVQENGRYVWLLDTEGFGSIDKDSNYDGKIFLLSLLMSSVVLYNSFGAIDENGIAKLALVCHQAQFVNPKFADVKLFWILRDFSLQMVDREGKELSSDQYLEECLRQEVSNSNKVEKLFLKRLFPVRHCSTLIRPVIDQTTLSNLQNVNKLYLREEFKQQISQLKKQIQIALNIKTVGGVRIDQSNVAMVFNEFVIALNNDDIDCGLTCTYQRVKEYQRQCQRERLVYIVGNKVQNTKKLLPVKQQHIKYLESEVKQLINQKIQEIKEYTSCQFVEGLNSSLSLLIQRQIQKLKKTNRDLIEQEIKDYLYRQMIEIYPKIISFTHSHFQTKLEQLLQPFKQNYIERYHYYYVEPKQIDYLYGYFMEKQIKKIFYQLVKRWRNNQKQLQEKLQELKQFKKQHEEELRKVKDDRQKSLRSLEEHRREEGRSLSRLKQQMEDTFKEQVLAVAKDYQQKLRLANQLKEKQLKQIKNQIQVISHQKITIETSLQYEKKSLLQKIEAQREKTDLTKIKYDQLKNTYDVQSEQLKASYQNKIRIAEMKYNETYNTLTTERKKFQMLTEERRIQETQILQQIQAKDQRIEDLTRELQGLQQKYKLQLQKILSEQKDILVKTINYKIQQYQYKIKVYQGKLQECSLALQDLQFYQHKNDELQVQVRELKVKLEEEIDRADSLTSKIKKYQTELSQKQNIINTIKNNYEKEINLANQNIYNNKKFIKEVEQRHQEEIEYYKRKLQVELAQQSNSIACSQEENLRQNRVLLQQRFQKERNQFKEIINNNYDEIEHLKIQKTKLANQVQKIYFILQSIRNKHQHLGQSTNKYQPKENQEQYGQNSYELGDISESPEQYSHQLEESNKKQKILKTEYLAQQIQQIYESLQQQVIILTKQRLQIRKEVKLQLQKLDSYESMLGKIKSQNKQYRSQIQGLRKKQITIESLSSQFGILQQKLQSIEKDNFQLKKQIQLKDIAAKQRQKSVKENVLIYKQTISNLSEQNRQISDHLKNLTQQNHTLQQQLQRFNLWAKEVVQSKDLHHGITLENRENISSDKIKDLQNEIRRLTKKSQQERLNKIQKQSKKQTFLSSYVNQNRVNQIQQLRKQNYILYQKLQEIHQLQLRNIEQKKAVKQKHNQYEQSRYTAIKQQYEIYKKKFKETITQLQIQLQLQVQQNSQLKKQFQDLQNNIFKNYEHQHKYMSQQIETLKYDKQALADLYSKKISILQESLNSKINQSDRKLAQTQLKYQNERQQIQKQQYRIALEGQRHRLKYQNLLKVNNQLLKQIQALKSKAHQITLKEKYKTKILNLFND